LGELVSLAMEKSPFYARSLASILGQVPAGDVLGHDAWSNVPILSRQTVVDHKATMCTVPPEQLDPASTDGSSGQPLAFFLDRNRSPIEYAFIHDAWSRAGYQASDWRCVFRGLDLIDRRERHMEIEPALRELRLSVFHLDDATMASYAREIRKRDIKFIHGYPSAISIFASYLVRTGQSPFRQIQGIFPISEKLFPHHRDLIAAAFGNAKLVPFYGMSEKVAFAIARENELDTYEFNPLYGYTELVDAKGQLVVIPGKTGRIVSTGLLFRGMPLIRYDTRDEAELVETPSSSNNYRLVVRRLLPRRSSESIIGRSGKLIPFSGLCIPIDENNLTSEVQFYQDTPGLIDLLVVAKGGEALDLSDYLARMEKRAGGDLAIRLKLVDQLPMTGRGKRKFVDQRLVIPQDESPLE
jgi:phenylacetate-CoA ligase